MSISDDKKPGWYPGNTKKSRKEAAERLKNSRIIKEIYLEKWDKLPKKIKSKVINWELERASRSYDSWKSSAHACFAKNDGNLERYEKFMKLHKQYRRLYYPIVFHSLNI